MLKAFIALLSTSMFSAGASCLSPQARPPADNQDLIKADFAMTVIYPTAPMHHFDPPATG